MTEGIDLVVHLAIQARDAIGDGDALLLALVRKHRSANAISDRPDLRGARAAVVVDLDESALVEHDARALGEQILRERPPADRDDQAVDDERLITLGVGVAHVHAVLLDFRAADLGAKTDVETELLEMTERFLGKLAIRHRQELIQRFEHHGLGSEPPPDAAEFEPDHARADHAEALRHLGELERAPGIHDALAVELDAPQGHGLRTGRQHDVFPL